MTEGSTNERDLPFRLLEPPPGGPERLRPRLASSAESRAPTYLRLAAGVSAVVLVLVGIVVLSSDPTGSRRGGADSARPDSEAAADSPVRGPAGADVSAPATDGPSLATAPAFDRLLGRPLQPSRPTVTLDDRTARLAEVESTNANVRIFEID
jgi:hypothetical protein